MPKNTLNGDIGVYSTTKTATHKRGAGCGENNFRLNRESCFVYPEAIVPESTQPVSASTRTLSDQTPSPVHPLRSEVRWLLVRDSFSFSGCCRRTIIDNIFFTRCSMLDWLFASRDKGARFAAASPAAFDGFTFPT